ncbi:MAG TPA: protein kinase [Kofleriaceae bacterium]|nr:protein kinase [Kofleriaceae bacterium]
MAGRDLYGRTLGEFVVREQIGEGGYGVVYRGEQPLLKRDVVIKVLHERRRSNEIAQERFLLEAQLASQLDHPYAAHVYAFGVEHEDGLLWIAMELVQGITLDGWLLARGPMPLEQFVPFFARVAQVVQAAHERGIVHRDLKPSNMMVIESGGSLYPKLLDFGIAKMDHEVASLVPEAEPDGAIGESEEPVEGPAGKAAVTARIRATPRRVQRTGTTDTDSLSGSPGDGHQLTPRGAVIGSRPYMSPEQWSNAGAVGPATDVYSLGVVAYEALTGRVPFSAERTGGYYRCHLYAEVPPLGGGFSGDLDRVIQRALAKRPEDRYGSVLEFASELRAAMRAAPREQLRSLARRWRERERSPDLLSRGKVLAELAQCARSPSKPALSELECSYLAESQRRARRLVLVRRTLVALAVCGVFGVFQYRTAMQARLAEQQARSAKQVAEAIATEAELEQGRAALLHGEPEAQGHLAEAYKRDHSPSTAFMFARALQPRLAEQARFTSTFERMWSATFSPDGRQLVTTDDKNAQVWDAQTYRPRFTLLHGDTVYQALYSADGTRIITACGDGAVRIFDSADGTLLRELRDNGKRLRYGAVAVTRDGERVAAIDVTGAMAHVWDATSGALLAELPNEGLDLFSIAFSADGRLLATSGGGDVRVFDARTWARVRVLAGQRRLSWDPTGPRLLTGSGDGDVSIWAIPSGARVRHLREVGEPVNRVAFSPNGELVVAAGEDGAVQIWDARTGKLRSQGNYLRSKILSVEFDRTSRLVVAAGASGSVAVADAALAMPVTVLDGPRNVVMVAHFDPSSRRVLGASWDGTARIWDATAPYRRWSSPPISDDCGLVTSLEPDRRFLAVGCRGNNTRIWDTARGQLLAELPGVTSVEGSGFASAYPAVSAEGDRAAIARGNTVEIYELPGGTRLRTIAHGAAVNAVAFAATGHDVVSGAVDGSLLVTHDDAPPLALPTPSSGIDVAGFLADGRVISADAQRRLRVYEPGGIIAVDFEVSARVRTLRMSPDGRRLITVPSFTNKTASPELWDLERYQPLAQLEARGQGAVYSARFVAGGQILTACGDGAARLWDAGTGRLRQTYRGGSRFLIDVTLSSDGSMVLAGGGDGLLRFWDVLSGRPLWTMPAHRSRLVGIRVEGNDIVTRGFSGDISRWTLPKPEQVIEACDGLDHCAIVPE